MDVGGHDGAKEGVRVAKDVDKLFVSSHVGRDGHEHPGAEVDLGRLEVDDDNGHGVPVHADDGIRGSSRGRCVPGSQLGAEVWPRLLGQPGVGVLDAVGRGDECDLGQVEERVAVEHSERGKGSGGRERHEVLDCGRSDGCSGDQFVAPVGFGGVRVKVKDKRVCRDDEGRGAACARPALVRGPRHPLPLAPVLGTGGVLVDGDVVVGHFRRRLGVKVDGNVLGAREGDGLVVIDRVGVGVGRLDGVGAEQGFLGHFGPPSPVHRSGRARFLVGG